MIMKAALFTGHFFDEKSKVVMFFDTVQKFTRTIYPVLNPLIYTIMSQKFRNFCKVNKDITQIFTYKVILNVIMLRLARDNH